jgi:hypothetical protein
MSIVKVQRHVIFQNAKILLTVSCHILPLLTLIDTDMLVLWLLIEPKPPPRAVAPSKRAPPTGGGQRTPAAAAPGSAFVDASTHKSTHSCLIG